MSIIGTMLGIIGVATVAKATGADEVAKDIAAPVADVALDVADVTLDVVSVPVSLALDILDDIF